ncbi:hypothetical protein [Photorhabdus luminescens]|uniref:Uncharacterized protein n=1 Tax=Photorhabdus luminescens subsp. mexicana TaxID=2100167 RepID=A0A4R4IPS3_PHOLU|nr:hypothetical protein [Photorhabdus luminescens]TDB42647.1 hypothetical protein C5468_24495 [Photorhabdus luminescens subsp. mexicana]
MSENKKHVHAELMMQYAQDALKTNEPWKLWEMYDDANELWEDIFHHPNWNPDFKYRRKPETEMITVGKVSFPKPVDYKLEYNDEYFMLDLTTTISSIRKLIWKNDICDNRFLELGIIHLTKEAAKQHAEALIKINKGEF